MLKRTTKSHIKLFTSLLICLLGNVFCHAQPKTTYYDNGACCVADSIDGEIICYDEKGRLHITGKFKNKQRDSIWTYYDNLSNGEKFAITAYQNGAIAQTIVWSFYGNRKLYAESTIARNFYSPCSKIIMQRTLYFYENGQPSANVIYKMGYITDGSYWNKDGKPITKDEWESYLKFEK